MTTCGELIEILKKYPEYLPMMKLVSGCDRVSPIILANSCVVALDDFGYTAKFTAEHTNRREVVLL